MRTCRSKYQYEHTGAAPHLAAARVWHLPRFVCEAAGSLIERDVRLEIVGEQLID
jgi:hypothetical protein